ncbi:molybdopterin cofactor-binding domain-containing protein [Serratia fonticola]|uniref:molybdopterin cofactor-binding domain-containing protein n=1 Tax=Serratia fonticola TaxID=47917 RepID=UPI00211D01ED|nr:molybdopterin cofactor-binding domain-containing protein [Serratia fonticola]
MQITRRRLLQAGGVVMVSSLLPFNELAGSPATTGKAIPLDRISSFIALSADGKVTAFNGHVDLGTGIRTSLAQIVADELDVAFDDVTLILGDTNRTPDQGPTIASASFR